MRLCDYAIFHLLWLIVISHSLLAQEGSFEPGYYISPTQDTVRGLLSREPDEVLARGLYFKANQEATVERVIPASAKEVVFTDSKETFVAISHKYVPFMEKAVKVQGRFMQLLLRGEVSLYRMVLTSEEQKRESASSENKLYYLQDGDAFYKLEALRQYTSSDRSDYNKQDRFKEVLKYVLREENVSAKRIDRTLFEDESIINLLLDSGILGEGVALEKVQKKERRKPVRNYYLDAGRPFVFEGNQQRAGHTFGGFVAFRNPARSNSRMLSVGLQYGIIKIEQVFDQAPPGTDTEVKLQYISIPVGLYWDSELREGKPFSMVAGFAIAPTILSTEGTKYRAPRIPFVQGAPPGGFFEIKNTRIGFRFIPELGVRFKRFALIGQWLSTFGSFGGQQTRSVNVLFRVRLKP
jgi:hypothetical protein